jgi:hypothetical protein
LQTGVGVKKNKSMDAISLFNSYCFNQTGTSFFHLYAAVINSCKKIDALLGLFYHTHMSGFQVYECTTIEEDALAAWFAQRVLHYRAYRL